MQPLATTRRMMTWLSMCSAKESSSARQKIAFVAYTLTFLCLNLIGFVASIAFCWKYFTIDFNGATFAFLIAIGEFGVIYFMFVAILMCYQIESIFTSLSTIYKSSEFNLLLNMFFSSKIFREDEFNYLNLQMKTNRRHLDT